MAFSGINKELKEGIRAQLKTVFGKKRYLFHIAIWLVALTYLSFDVLGDDLSEGFKVGVQHGKAINPQAGSKVTVNSNNMEDAPIAVVTTISTVVAAVMVYFYLLLVIPYARYKRQRRYIWLGIVVNCTIWMVTIMVAAFVMGYKYGHKEKLQSNDTVFILLLASLFAGVIAGLFFSLYYFIDLYDQQKELNRYRQVLTEKMEAETNFLKTQINPHFLFNTLNNIYSLTMSRPEDAAAITRQLKDLVTYMLRECAQEKVPLEGELRFLKNYITLEQLRNKQEQADIRLEIKGETAGKEIAPLLLINFIENAFKHGVKAGIDQAFVRINLLIMNNRLDMEILNSKPSGDTDTSKAVKEDGGIGIMNVKRRLAILYPHRHKLRIVPSKEEYAVYLTIDL